MIGIFQLVTSLLFLVQGSPPAVPAVPPASGDSKSITAGEWINPLHLRLPDERTWVLFFFRTRYPETANKAELRRKLETLVKRLNQLSRERRDLMIVGLTEESRDDIQGFLAETQPRFAIGVRSPTHKTFGVEDFPSVIVVRRENVEVAASPDRWESLLPPLAPDSGAPPLDELTIEELQERVTRDPTALSIVDGEAGQALERLRLRLAPEEFMAYCDQIEHAGGVDAVWTGRVRYQKHLADPNVVEKLPFGTPASDAAGEWRRSRDDPRWAPMRAFFEEFNNRRSVTVESVVEAHHAHLTDDPNDLLIRFWLAQSVRDRKDVGLLPALRAVYDAEPDAVVRSQILLGMCELAPTGDAETLRFLEERMKTESHFRAGATLGMVHSLIRDGMNKP